MLNGTIVRAGIPYPPANLSELEVLPGVVEGCMALRAAGFLLVMVTNQPDVARGTLERETVEAINQALRDRVALDDIRVCYHDDQDECSCRKPLPGMLLQAAEDWQIDLSASFMVGDRWRDIEAGRRAGCVTVFIDYEYAEPERSAPDHRARSLAETTDLILQRSSYRLERGKDSD